MVVAVAAVLLGVLLLVVLVEGEACAADGDGGGDALLDLVGVRMVGVLLGLVLLVHGVRSRCDGAELGELLRVLVVLLLLAPVGDLGRRLAGGGGLAVVLAQEVVRHLDGADGRRPKLEQSCCELVDSVVVVVVRDDVLVLLGSSRWMMDVMRCDGNLPMFI